MYMLARNYLINFFMTLSCALVQANELTVVVDTISRKEGSLYLALYDNEAGYKKGQPYATHRVVVTDLVMVISFKDFADGDYAVKLYHDVNNDNELDTGLFGIPVEG